MGLRAYLPHLIYSTALTSVTMHHLYQRKDAEEDRAHVAAQLSILEDLRTRLCANEHIPDREYDRLCRLAQSHDVWTPLTPSGGGDVEPGSTSARVKTVHIQPKDTIGWKEVLLGRRFESSRTDELDRRDLEKVRQEVESSPSE